tara:strand:+ start:316 stop:615 length:300 start_codon:yes stop_codon:yes gene_type:complete
MARVTLKNLKGRLEVINRLTEDETDRFDKKVGPYFIQGANGGYCLYKKVGKAGSGGWTNAFTDELYTTKYQLYRRMGTFINGLSVGSKLADKQTTNGGK